MSQLIEGVGQVLIVLSGAWLVIGFIVWLALGVLAVSAVRGHSPSEPRCVSAAPLKPSFSSTDGLAAAALYLSITVTLIGIGAMVGWELAGDDRFGVFSAMTLLADLLTVVLVVTYFRIVAGLRRDATAPTGLLWLTFGITVAGQALALAVLITFTLQHTGVIPFFF